MILESLNYKVTTRILILSECQFIFRLVLISSVLRQLNSEILNDKRNVELMPYYSSEVFILYGLVNKSFNHILWKIILFIDLIKISIVLWKLCEQVFGSCQIIDNCTFILLLFYCQLNEYNVLNQL